MTPVQRDCLEELADTLFTDDEPGFAAGESTEAIRAALAEIDRLRAELAQARELVLELEWIRGTNTICATCGAYAQDVDDEGRRQAHRPGCRIAAFLSGTAKPDHCGEHGVDDCVRCHMPAESSKCVSSADYARGFADAVEASALVADGHTVHFPNTTNDAAEEMAHEIAAELRALAPSTERQYSLEEMEAAFVGWRSNARSRHYAFDTSDLEYLRAALTKAKP